MFSVQNDVLLSHFTSTETSCSLAYWDAVPQNILVLLSPKYHFPKVSTTDSRKFMELTSKTGNFCQRHLLLLLPTVATTPQFPVSVTASMSPAWATSFCPHNSLPGSLETTFIFPALLRALEPLGVKDATDVQLLWEGFLLQKRNPHGQTITILGNELSTARQQWQEMTITPGGACYLCQILGCSSSTFLKRHPLPLRQDMRPRGCTTHAQN